MVDPPVRSGIPAQTLADLASVCPDLLCAVRQDGTFVAVNPAWERMLGWRAEDLEGRVFLDFLGDADRARTRRIWVDRVLAGETVTDFENLWPQRTGGSHRWISWSASLGRETGLVYCSGRDITERVEKFVSVATEAALLTEAERVAEIGVWEWDVTLDHAYLSRGLCRIFGTTYGERFSFDELLARTVPEDRDRLAETVGRSIEAGEPFDVQYRFVRPDGREVAVWERGEPDVEDGRTVRMFGTVKDITERQAVEEELRRAAASEHAVAERLRELDRVKTSFMSAVSHELRTPLAVVQGMAETLQRHRERLDDGARAEVEDALVEHSQRLTDLLTNLLDIDRLARGTVTPDPLTFDLVELVREVVVASRTADRARIEAPTSLEVRLDRLQTERILANLLDNAAKYAPHGEVLVAVEPLPDGGARLSVADEGPGIGDGDLTRIFEPFHRLDDDHPQPGTGMGLALVAEFAALHGGRSWAEPRDTGGATFVVELPDLP